MCTLILAWQVFADAPVAVVANRDERADRRADPPAVRDWDARVLAPQDREANGTWIGYNEHGVFAGVTNRWLPQDVDADRSRGLLVRDTLEHESAESAARAVEREVAETAYDGFNLVLADTNTALYLEWDGGLSVRHLQPGVRVAVNVGLDGDATIPDHRPEEGRAQADNAVRVRAAVQPEPGEHVHDWVDRAADVVSDHDYGVCIHREGTDPATGETVEFGTQSSSLVVLGQEEHSYRYADGPPCRTEFRDVEGQV